MSALKPTALAITAGALLCMPMAPAMAAGPFFFAPLVLGHILDVATRLATLPLVVASAAASVPVAAGGYYGQPAYYPQPSAYYGMPRPYYPPVVSYPYYSAPRFYGPSRAYHAPVTRYSGYYGAQASYRTRGYSYRGR